MYRYILRESCSQFDSLPLTSLTIHWGASQWALLSIASNVAVAAAASLVPGARRAVGAQRAACALALCAALSSVVAARATGTHCSSGIADGALLSTLRVRQIC